MNLVISNRLDLEAMADGHYSIISVQLLENWTRATPEILEIC